MQWSGEQLASAAGGQAGSARGPRAAQRAPMRRSVVMGRPRAANQGTTASSYANAPATTAASTAGAARASRRQGWGRVLVRQEPNGPSDPALCRRPAHAAARLCTCHRVDAAHGGGGQVERAQRGVHALREVSRMHGRPGTTAGRTMQVGQPGAAPGLMV